MFAGGLDYHGHVSVGKLKVFWLAAGSSLFLFACVENQNPARFQGGGSKSPKFCRRSVVR